MDKITGRVLGGAISGVLLLVYVWAAFDMIIAVYGQRGVPPEQAQQAVVYSQGFLNTVVTLGGLISALVVVTLGRTNPGEMPGLAQMKPGAGTPTKWAIAVVGVYLFVWMSVGAASLVVGVMLVPDVLPTVADIGNNWLGLAVASAYAYFGIKDGGQRSGDSDSATVDDLAVEPVPIGAGKGGAAS